jgi:hypothetical protein
MFDEEDDDEGWLEDQGDDVVDEFEEEAELDEEDDEAPAILEADSGEVEVENLVDDDVYASADEFPDAAEEDFWVDEGDWSVADYEQSAENLFGSHQYFGDTLETQLADRGYAAYRDPAFDRVFDSISPGTSQTVQLFERNGVLNAFGFVPMAVLQALLLRYPGMDFSGLRTTIPSLGERVTPRPLPKELASVQEADNVDLRKYCSPVGDQRQTSRCSAFAWTHAHEMTQRIVANDSTRLSANYTMLGIQEMQGDARDFRYAYKGGEGSIGGPEPGEVLRERGTCRHDFWPDDSPQPVVDERYLEQDAAQRRLPGLPYPIALDDVRKVLTAGMPVHLAMNTGERFANIGRDGVVHAAEGPWGDHGRHAMLLTGYTGNYFIVKNSWGTDWGDRGYCYIPRKVLQESEADFVAVLVGRS